MTLQNYRLYRLDTNSRGNAVRIVKRLLHSKTDNSYQTDNTNIYTPQLASAVSELQRRHRLPITGAVGQAEYWALGKDEEPLKLQYLSGGDQTLNRLLRGGVFGNAIIETSSSAEGQAIDSIVITGDHWAVWLLDDGQSKRRVKEYVSDDTKTLINANIKSMVINVYRAIVAVNALNDFPVKSTGKSLSGSITLEGGVTIAPGVASGGNAGASLQMGASYSREYDSSDTILRELTIANKNIRINLAYFISTHKIAVPNADQNVAVVMTELGQVEVENGKTLAVNFATKAAEKANMIAQDFYKTYSDDKVIPSEFLSYFSGIKVF